MFACFDAPVQAPCAWEQETARVSCRALPSPASRQLLLEVLDRVGGAQNRLVGVQPELLLGPALAQQIPVAIQRDADLLETRALLDRMATLALGRRKQAALLRNENFVSTLQSAIAKGIEAKGMLDRVRGLAGGRGDEQGRAPVYAAVTPDRFAA